MASKVESVLGVDDHAVVLKHLWEARSQWFSIGLALGVHIRELENIQKESNDEVDECFSKMLFSWLQQVNPQPTWSKVIEVLKSPTVDNGALAEELSSKLNLLGGVTFTQANEPESAASNAHQVVGVDDHAVVLNHLWKARPQWFNIGIGLGVDMMQLKKIQKESNNEVDECFSKMLLSWLQKVNPQPTWSKVIEVLKSPIVRYAFLAEEISSKLNLSGGVTFTQDQEPESAASNAHLANEPESAESNAHLVLGVDDHAVVLKHLLEVRRQWYMIGVGLGVDPRELENIQRESKHNSDECLSKVLLLWLQKVNPQPTWSKVIEVLKSPIIGFVAFAEELSSKLNLTGGVTFTQDNEPESAASNERPGNEPESAASNAHLVLGVDDHAVVLKHLWKARSRWFDIGIELGVHIGELETIEMESKECDECLSKMLYSRLQKVNPQLTWSKVIETLKSPIVGDVGMAEELSSKLNLSGGCSNDV